MQTQQPPTDTLLHPVAHPRRPGRPGPRRAADHGRHPGRPGRGRRAVVREAGPRSGAVAGRVAQLSIVDRVLISVAHRSTPHQTEAAPQATFDAARDLRMEGHPRR